MNRNMIDKTILAGTVCAVLFLLSCTFTQTPAPAATEPARAAVQQQGWEQDWQKTLAAAKQEGLLVIYTATPAQTRQGIGKGFKDKYGLDIDWVMGTGAEMTAKIIQERRAGLYIGDFALGMTTGMITDLKPGGYFDPIKPLLVLPEVLDKSLWFRGEIPWVDNEKMYLMNSILTPDYNLAVNTSLVKPDEIKSYNDLLDPRWKGKIALTNPTVIVRPFTSIATVMGLDWWRKLAATQEPVIASNERQLVEWLAHGKYPVVIFSQASTLDEFIKVGAPIKRVQPKEGSAIRGAIVATGLLNRAPHPNAAKVFVNWYLSKDGGTVQSIAVAGQSARLDVPVDHLEPELRRDSSAKYVDTETEEFFLKSGADRAAGGAAWEIFGTITGRK